MKRRHLILTLLVMLVLAATSMALAQDSGYTLPWWTSDGGGGDSRGGGYSLSGTIGQPDADILSGGNYLLEGGFWGGGSLVTPPLRIYLPLTTKP